MDVAKIFSSEYPIKKRIVGLAKSLTNNGFGRTILKINDKYNFTSFNKARKFIKWCKICLHPLDKLRRNAVARKVQRDSKKACLLSEKTGYAILPPGTIPGSDKIVAACQKFYRDSQQKLENLMDKTPFCYMLLETEEDEYDLRLSSEDIYDLRLVPGLTEFALNPVLIEAAAGYLGEVPILAGVTLYASFPNETKVGSQLFHVDKGDFRQVKFCFLITDATEKNGPFTFLPADKAEKVAEKINEDFFQRVSDEAVYSVVNESDVVKLLGPAGSCLIVDTGRCLHYGSRGNKKTRCLLEIQYMSPFNTSEPSFYFSCVKAEKLPSDLSFLQKLAIARTQFIKN